MSQAYHLFISVEEQRLQVKRGEEVVREFPVSTSKNGLGSEEGSYKTPLGLFEISEKIGSGKPRGTIFEARKPVGIWEGEANEKDMILTRIIRLHGLEESNANTMDRYIYIHGTNQESQIGTPVSCGCIRMKNADIEELFELVEEGGMVEIF